jgi:ABC-type multidrug transport system fused ATPase/permease subunit
LVDADKIIVLKEGVVVEEGSHQSLIARGGVFAKLHRAQQPADPIHAASAA